MKLGAWVGLALGAAAPLGASIAARALQVQATAPLDYVSLQAIASDPQAFLGRTARVRFQIESHLRSWNPYLTRFGSDDWRGLRVWADEQLLWEREAWDAPAARVFVRLGSVSDEVLEGAPKLARFEAVAHVRQVFGGAAWLELEQVQRLAGSIGEGSVLHAARALEHLERAQWRNALDNLDRALLGEMPDAARARLRHLREQALAELGKR